MWQTINKFVSKYLKYLYEETEEAMRTPHETQHAMLMQLVQKHADTEWGRRYGFDKISSPKDFARQVPIVSYETIKGQIERMMNGEADVLATGQVDWFAKSSGTTNSVSKFIPVTKDSLKNNHIMCGWKTLAYYYKNNPNAEIFARKTVLLGGTLYEYPANKNTKTGDISALLFHNMPAICRSLFLAQPDIISMPNIEQKIMTMAELMVDEDISMIGGVPTWTNILIQYVLQYAGTDDIFEVWPNLELYVHGGVNFEPHRAQFNRYFSNKKIAYQEIYNASEGYFGIQDDLTDKGMKLILNGAVYFEFMPKSEWEAEHPRAIPLEEVELGVDYAIIITTASGLWRYSIGDTVQFTSLQPYKIIITGRTTLFINVFGEEVVIANTDKAIAQTCNEFEAILNEYTLAPIYFEEYKKGGHEWVIEFSKAPQQLEQFAEKLDLNLQKLNSDYQAKRFNSLALERLKLHTVPPGTFSGWMKNKGKYGGQHKVPRLSNNRNYVEDILHFSGKFA